MFSLEQLYYERVLGVQKEHPTNAVAATLRIGLSELYARIFRLKIQGSAPDKGPVIFIFNHLDWRDLFRLTFALVHHTVDENGEKAVGRLARGIVKSTLFGIPEPEMIRERTGKRDILNSDHPLVQAVNRRSLIPFLYGSGFFPYIRGTRDEQAAAEIERTLKAGHGLGTSVMESRDKTGGLKGLKTGAALIVKSHPDVPFQLLGISRHPHRINASKLQTYAAIRAERGIMSFNDLTMFFADGIVDLLPEPIQERWRAGERDIEYQALHQPRARTATSN